MCDCDFKADLACAASETAGDGFTTGLGGLRAARCLSASGTSALGFVVGFVARSCASFSEASLGLGTLGLRGEGGRNGGASKSSWLDGSGAGGEGDLGAFRNRARAADKKALSSSSSSFGRTVDLGNGFAGFFTDNGSGLTSRNCVGLTGLGAAGLATAGLAAGLTAGFGAVGLGAAGLEAGCLDVSDSESVSSLAWRCALPTRLRETGGSLNCGVSGGDSDRLGGGGGRSSISSSSRA